MLYEECMDVLRDLEDTIDLIDDLMKCIMEFSRSRDIDSSIKFRAYTILVDLREKIVSVRMYIRRYCIGK